MDELDWKILNKLNENARKSYRQIAKELNVSMSTISNRVKIMENDGLILGYVPVIDQQRIGFDLMAMIGVRISKGKLMDVQTEISTHPAVTGVFDITGEWDSIVVARFRNRTELNTFIKWVVGLHHIERTYTQIVLNVVKDETSGRLPLPAGVK